MKIRYSGCCSRRKKGGSAGCNAVSERRSMEMSGMNYNLAFASYILALIPILIFYIICQKQILNGVANGAVKG